jgi:phosphate transport system substrate-binding protein
VALRYRTLLAVAAAVSFALTVAACSSGGSPSSPAVAPSSGPGGAIPLTPAPASETLSESGSTLLHPLMGAWATAYQRLYSNVSFRTASTGSGKGVDQASAGTVDIGASDAYLSSGQLVTNPTLLNIPLAIAAQQVNYYLPGLPAGVHLKLDGSVLAQMYDGQITTWNATAIRKLNPGVALPGTTVVPLHRSGVSGDTFLFTSYLSTHDSSWNAAFGYGTSVAWPAVPGALAENNNATMVSGCRATVGCVAYIGISYLNAANQAGLGLAQLANTLGQYELPTPATISTAVASFVSSTPPNETISMVDGPASGGYPIVNYEYAIVSTRQHSTTTARDIKAFLHWAITTGNYPGFLGPVQFQPLPGPVVALCDAQIAKIS